VGESDSLTGESAPGPVSFHQLGEDRVAIGSQAYVHAIFESISDDYDLMNDIESFRLHRSWKLSLIKAVVAEVVSPAVILDIACGTGDIALSLATRLPDCQIIGLDYSKNMLAVAKKRSKALPEAVPRAEFVFGDAMHLPFTDASIDAITISFGLRNLPDFALALQEFSRVLVPGGKLFCLEASYPTAPFIKPLFRLYFKYLMPRMASLVVGHRQQYQWLNDSTEAFLSKPDLAALMQECGFSEVSFKSFFFGVAALHRGQKA
jgi:demethylmenaquinone methyltransferase/2-methoxy-6-polyprenyl-1,4-benzoquinol methylase